MTRTQDLCAKVCSPIVDEDRVRGRSVPGVAAVHTSSLVARDRSRPARWRPACLQRVRSSVRTR